MTPRLCVVDAEMHARIVCQRMHRGTGLCFKIHSVPTDAFWQGYVDKGLHQDFVIVVREARKAFQKAHRRWERQLCKLSNTKHAPAFSGYLRSVIDKHKTTEPKFTFQYESVPHGETTTGR